MHIQATAFNQNAVGLQSAAAAEKAASLQRAADVRRRLGDTALRLRASSEGESVTPVTSWSENSRQQSQAPYERNTVSGGSADGEASSAPPFSLWA